MKNTLYSAVVNLDEKKVIKLIKEKLKNSEEPLAIINEINLGVKEVGDLYASGKYFIADLIMSGLIFKEVMDNICFQQEDVFIRNKITAVFATVEADIHDIGKNITIDLFKSKGINVIDLGVDVPPATILENIENYNSNILCLSGLLSSSYNSMKNTIKRLEEKNIRNNVKIIIGGNVSEDVMKLVHADYWAKDCTYGLKICKEIAGNDFNNKLE